MVKYNWSIQEVKESGTESELVLLCIAVMWYDRAKIDQGKKKETELLLIVILCAAILWLKIQFS